MTGTNIHLYTRHFSEPQDQASNSCWKADRKQFNLHIILASSLETMQPRFLILLCLQYGRYGMTPTMLRADEVLQA
ncbi:hypothetical protein E2C01_002720 [Portunus trituberculatus]|uniref:Uncharacterized protein n=1 Tax=Portunus trituberculatus TaxID=210409 RepID=A0A5B7CK69_PORTR|nr:hypothetical protein [Portunus trituberculatus]